MINSIVQAYGHIIKYLMVGGTNTLISIVLYYLLLKIGVFYLLANTICFIIGVILGYSLNSMFVFNAKINFRGLKKYIFVYSASLGLNLLFLSFLVTILNFDKMLAQIITIAIVTIVNYLIIKRFVFHR
jgi:putative flippase GtrA